MKLREYRYSLLNEKTPLVLGCALLGLFCLLTALVIFTDPLRLDLSITLELQEPRGLQLGG